MTLSEELNNSILNTFQNCINSLSNLCESEIEKIFLLKVIYYITKRPDRYSLSLMFKEEDTEIINGIECVSNKVNYYLPDGFGRLYGIKILNLIDNKNYIEIIPQKEIDFFDLDTTSNKLKYRLDFGVYKYSNNDNKNILKKYCVECDGYDFHSNKDQIKRDNNRMLDLLLENDYITIRYLGTTIFNMNENDIGKILIKFTSSN